VVLEKIPVTTGKTGRMAAAVAAVADLVAGE
jgi:hypothetical protein